MIGLIFETIHTPEQIEFLMAIAKMPKESIKIIHKDVAGKTKGGKFTAHLSLKNDMIFADGKATGIRISSYSPFNISFNGNIWFYDQNQSADKNYFNLTKMLRKKGVASLSRFLLPEAKADDADRPFKDSDPAGDAAEGAGATALISGMVGLFVGLITFSTWPVWLGIGAVVVAISGISYALSYKSGLKADAEERALAAKIMSSDPLVACSEDAVSITAQSGSDRSGIHIDRKVLSSASVRIFDTDGTEVATTKIPAAEQQKIADAMKNCKTPQNAEMIMASWKSAGATIAGTGDSHPAGKDFVR